MGRAGALGEDLPKREEVGWIKNQWDIIHDDIRSITARDNGSICSAYLT